MDPTRHTRGGHGRLRRVDIRNLAVREEEGLRKEGLPLRPQVQLRKGLPVRPGGLRVPGSKGGIEAPVPHLHPGGAVLLRVQQIVRGKLPGMQGPLRVSHH